MKQYFKDRVFQYLSNLFNGHCMKSLNKWAFSTVRFNAKFTDTREILMDDSLTYSIRVHVLSSHQHKLIKYRKDKKCYKRHMKKVMLVDDLDTDCSDSTDLFS